jgi:hypothetical protein
MKTIESESIGKIASLELSYVIFFWNEYDAKSVVIAYDELIKRGYPISGNLYVKMSEFRKKQLQSKGEMEI